MCGAGFVILAEAALFPIGEESEISLFEFGLLVGVSCKFRNPWVMRP